MGMPEYKTIKELGFTEEEMMIALAAARPNPDSTFHYESPTKKIDVIGKPKVEEKKNEESSSS